MTPEESARYVALATQFHRDRIIQGQELAEYALLYFASRGNSHALADYRRLYGGSPPTKGELE